eukprot:TRINITY_DN15523_c0_g1_i4.p2 TRINITY_DN15523_c0_g1~~TRINITY_DN15523_c0_g1_i4.p2  ORF type:complete len:134 (-),score=4.55 TRINITY_DN15523_c0_g1_i4:35-436(-)
MHFFKLFLCTRMHRRLSNLFMWILHMQFLILCKLYVVYIIVQQTTVQLFSLAFLVADYLFGRFVKTGVGIDTHSFHFKVDVQITNMGHRLKYLEFWDFVMVSCAPFAGYVEIFCKFYHNFSLHVQKAFCKKRL